MKNKSRKLTQNDSLSPELGANLYQRLRQLSSLLTVISESLSESNAAAKAYAMVQTALMLEMINYDVMNEVSRLMLEVDACNIFPTVKETKVPRQTIVDATELADDILADLPICYRVVKQGEVVITGAIVYLRRLVTKKNDIMAVADIIHEDKTSTEIVIFPKTLARYRDILEALKNTGAVRSFICDFDGKSNILKEIKFTDVIQSIESHSLGQDEPQSQEQQIKELVFLYGRANQLRRFAELGSEFHQEQRKRASALYKKLHELGVFISDMEDGKWQGYFEEGQGTYAVYGSFDENLPDIQTLIQDYEASLAEETEWDS